RGAKVERVSWSAYRKNLSYFGMIDLTAFLYEPDRDSCIEMIRSGLCVAGDLQNKGPFRGPCNTSESHRVFCCLHGTCPDDLPSRSSLEFHRLLSEGINALARLGGGLLNDDELCKARNQKGTGLLEFFIANG